MSQDDIEFNLWAAEQNLAQREDDYHQYLTLTGFAVVSALIYFGFSWLKPAPVAALPVAPVVSQPPLPLMPPPAPKPVKPRLIRAEPTALVKAAAPKHTVKKKSVAKHGKAKAKSAPPAPKTDDAPDNLAQPALPPGFAQAGTDKQGQGRELFWNEDNDGIFLR